MLSLHVSSLHVQASVADSMAMRVMCMACTHGALLAVVCALLLTGPQGCSQKHNLSSIMCKLQPCFCDEACRCARSNLSPAEVLAPASTSSHAAAFIPPSHAPSQAPSCFHSLGD
ncbi:hypothetical protein V8C86DRAFT_2769309 [Haematococcus lacustris]